MFEDFRYTDELEIDGAHALIFRAAVAARIARSRASTCCASTRTV